jgi:hypothetical protein
MKMIFTSNNASSDHLSSELNPFRQPGGAEMRRKANKAQWVMRAMVRFAMGLSKKPIPEYSCQTIFGQIDFCPLGDKMLVVNYHNQPY